MNNEKPDRRFSDLSDWCDSDGGDDGAHVLHQNVGEFPHQIADQLFVHGLLQEQASFDEAHNRKLIERMVAEITGSNTERKLSRRFAGRLLLVSSLAVAACLLIALGLFQASTAHAATALKRVIDAVSQPTDRTYEISVAEERPKQYRRGKSGERKRGDSSFTDLSGAKLYVRGPNHFVFVRKLGNGETRISGCDGQVCWAFKDQGDVHVSSDLQRFRGGLPGGQQDLPFVNLRQNLEQLQAGYEITLTELETETGSGQPLSALRGVKKSRAISGPKFIDVWFHPDTGVVESMYLDGLARGKGGPRGVLIELEAEQDLGAEFFSHEFHHGPERHVRYED
ncbi:MAG: hypothetical protein NXI32_23410 [bacterium]|nr:hypothetical protein [bacterium]